MRRVAAVLGILVLALAACSSGPTNLNKGDVADARARWEASGINVYRQQWKGTIDGERATVVIESSDGFVKQRRVEVEVGRFDMPALFDAMDQALEDGNDVIADFYGDGAPKSFTFPLPSGAVVDMTSFAFWSAKREPACENGSGSALDLSREPVPFVVQRDDVIRWYDADDCPVRIDVLSITNGPAHCDWDEASFLTVGPATGAIIEPEASRTFLYDPKRTLGDHLGEWGQELPADTPLSGDVTDSGYHTADDRVLWVDEQDPTAPAWIVGPDHVERWDAITDDAFGCA